METNTLGSTLRKLRDDSKMSVKDVIQELKMYGQDISDKTLYSYESGKRAASADMFLALCQIYKCKNVLEVFSDFELDYSIPDDSEWNLIEIYRRISNENPIGKEIIDFIIDREHARCTTTPKTDIKTEQFTVYPARDVIQFQLSEYKASAGRGTYLGPEAFTTIMVVSNTLTKRALFGVPVSGDSMEPTYNDGDILIVERADALEEGEIGIFTLDGEGYVKECGKGELISLNPKYEPISMNDGIVLNGRVIGILDREWIVE